MSKLGVLVFSVIPLFLVGCESGYNCSDRDAVRSEYEINEYSIEFSYFNSSESSSDETLQTYVLGEEIAPIDFAIVLDSEVSWPEGEEAPLSKSITFSLFNVANACSPAVYYIPLQRVVSFQITSTGSFGSEYPAGEDISELFIEHDSNVPLARRISQYVEGGITDEEIPPLEKTLRLMEVPEDSDHVFTVTIALDDESLYEFVSPEVTFNLN